MVPTGWAVLSCAFSESARLDPSAYLQAGDGFHMISIDFNDFNGCFSFNDVS